MVAIIAVHCGAGTFKPFTYPKFKKLLRIACRRGIALLKDGKSALEVVKEVIKILENDALTNCGTGSNLTNIGTVEMDASIMDGENLIFGACGAVKNIKNPIELAYEIHANQRIISPFGLIPPSLLVGKGALDFAKKSKLRLVKNKHLISAKALKQYKKYKLLIESNSSVINTRLDTVGAVCIDLDGRIASGCSSGGILLKNPGRIGQAAVYASGVWAEKYATNSIGVCTSGCGEYLVRTHFAKTISDKLNDGLNPVEDLSEIIQKDFLDSKYVKGAPQKLCGALVLHANNESGDVNIMWGHSTDAMGVGYMSSNDVKPIASFSELPATSRCVVAGAYVFNDSVGTIHSTD